MQQEMTRRARRSHGRRRSMVKIALAGALATAVATAIAVAGSGATFAALSSSTLAMPSTSVSSGAAELTVTSPAPFTLLAPGVSQSASFSVTNTGDVALDLSVDSATFTGALASSTTVAVRAGGTCDGTSGSLVWTRTPSAPAPTGPVGATIASGATVALCMTVTVAADAPATAEGATMTSSVVIGGQHR